MGARYDLVASIVNDHVSYVVPNLEADDVPQADDLGMKRLSTANLDVIRVSVITTYAEYKRKGETSCYSSSTIFS
jgi:hypothetical protein